MTNPFEQLRQAIELAELEIEPKSKQSLYLPPIPNGQFNLLRTVLWNTQGLRYGGWHLDEYAEIEIEKDNLAGIQELKQRLLSAIDITFQTFSNAMTVNSDGLPILLYERVEHITENAEFPESGIEYTFKELLQDTQRDAYIDCSITPLFVPDRRIVPKEDSDAAYRGITEEELNAPKLASDNELLIMAAGYPTGNDGLLSGRADDYVDKKLHSVVFFGEGGAVFLEKLGLLDALMKNIQPAPTKQIGEAFIPAKLTM